MHYICREYVYNSEAASPNNQSALNSYCVETVCDNHAINSSMFTPENCSHSLCVSDALTPTVPDINSNPHWFFSYILYVGGVIHLLMSCTMVIFFFVMNSPYFNLPLYEFYLYVNCLQ